MSLDKVCTFFLLGYCWLFIVLFDCLRVCLTFSLCLGSVNIVTNTAACAVHKVSHYHILNQTPRRKQKHEFDHISCGRSKPKIAFRHCYTLLSFWVTLISSNLPRKIYTVLSAALFRLWPSLLLSMKFYPKTWLVSQCARVCFCFSMPSSVEETRASVLHSPGHLFSKAKPVIFFFPNILLSILWLVLLCALGLILLYVLPLLLLHFGVLTAKPDTLYGHTGA